MGTTYYSLGRKLHQRTTSIAKIVVSAIVENATGEAIVSLVQNQQNGGYLEDNTISLLSQGIGIQDLFSYRVQSLLFLQDLIDCCVLTHARLQLPSNEVLQMESATWSVNS